MTPLIINDTELLNNLDTLVNMIKDKINDNTINYIVNSINYMFFNFKQALKDKYEKDMNKLRTDSNNRTHQLNDKIFKLKNEIRYLIIQQQEPIFSKKNIIAEVLEIVDIKKHTMEDQSYRDITEKLMIIYNR